MDGQAFAFEITFGAGSQVPASAQARCVTASRSHTSCLQAARDVVLAAADEVTRHRCMRIIRAASAGTSSMLQDIASAAALTPCLLGMQDLSAVNAVLAALGKTAVKGLGFRSLKLAGFTEVEAKAAGCDFASARAVGYDEWSLIEVFGYDAMIASGCNANFILVRCSSARVH